MAEDHSLTSTVFDRTCQDILRAHPDAVGVAYKVLDCGCSLLCGVSVQGDPVGVLLHASGQPAQLGRRPSICLKCKLDNGLKRVVWEGLFWAGTESAKPEKAFRLMIGRKVFGPGYFEPD